MLESLSNEVTGLSPVTLLKERHWCFPVNIAKFWRTAFL